MNKRPFFLSMLLWIALVSNILALFLVLTSFFMHGGENPGINPEEMENMPVYMQWLVDYWFSGFRYFYLIAFIRIVLIGIVFYGLKLLFDFRRKGFYVFTAGQVLLAIIPFTFHWGNPIAGILTGLQFFIVCLYVFLLATQFRYLQP